MSVGRKRQAQVAARIETQAVAQHMPSYGGSVEHLPASFWRRFQESLDAPLALDTLDPAEWSLVQAAKDLGYRTGHDLIASVGWSAFVAARTPAEAAPAILFHTAFAALSGLGLDDCEIIDLVPYEELVLRVYGYWGLLIPGPDRNRRTAGLVVRGLCAALMELAYGGLQDGTDRPFGGGFVCIQSRNVEQGDPHDEFVVTRRVP